jgi:hypothetical protein
VYIEEDSINPSIYRTVFMEEEDGIQSNIRIIGVCIWRRRMVSSPGYCTCILTRGIQPSIVYIQGGAINRGLLFVGPRPLLGGC